ncbi:SGNH/GDSL hydrolase family protein [Anatilimnocola sp. NA78]|uniref:SGNH/GDSL hydrolase family protein n=1 Tax=Anatilimnocola sp. NA78 TaxID=3415683 RepID=UPI003CE4513F
MLRRVVLFALLILSPALLLAADTTAAVDAAKVRRDDAAKIEWYDARVIGLEGQAFTDVKAPYDRLPARAEGKVRPPVWSLSQNSAGICVRFRTDSPTIHCQWTNTSSRLAMPHMPATGVSGVDLYVRDDKGTWRWLSIGQPKEGTKHTATLVEGLAKQDRDYCLYLPLYNGVSQVEIGVAEGSKIERLVREEAKRLPIVFYGTSITQGGCASRPGMVHTAILGRRLNRPVINLGFSGNGKMEPEVTACIVDIEAAAYVIDCLPNMTAAEVTANTAPLVATLRKAHPNTPIVLAEDRTYSDAFLKRDRAERNTTSRATLQKIFAELQPNDKLLFYLPGEQQLGSDGEDTVDGSHPTDLGFLRMADEFSKVLEPLLKK